MKEPVQVVTDTNVLVAAARSRRGASFRLVSLFVAGDRRWEWNISAGLLLEYEAVLKREQHRMGRDIAVVDGFLDDLAARANRQGVFYLVRPFLSDPDDELVLELAFASASAYIATCNCDDYRGAERFGVNVATPAAFLRIIGETS